jgi:hypothetical protein
MQADETRERLREKLALEVIANVHAGDECEDCRKIIDFCMPLIGEALDAERLAILNWLRKQGHIYGTAGESPTGEGIASMIESVDLGAAK